LIGAAVFGVFALGCGAVPVLMLRRERRYRREGVTVSGRVVKLEEGRGGGAPGSGGSTSGNRTYHPLPPRRGLPHGRRPHHARTRIDGQQPASLHPRPGGRGELPSGVPRTHPYRG